MTVRDSASNGTVAADEVELRLEAHRVELTGYCYRMLGSVFEAEDAVQETLVRAWRSHGGFEGRSSLRSWLYRIATNVCLDSLNAGKRRARPMDLSPASHADAALPAMSPESIWIEPVPDVRALPSAGDPADVVVARETIKLAFVAALQHLPARQRAVLILREVLAWKASETAELLGTSVASVNSALQRARATLGAAGVSATAPATAPMDEDQEKLLARYVDAFERYDLDSLTSLLHEDATMQMPPFPLWLRGHADIRAWFLGTGIGCRGSRLVPAAATNGSPAFGQYRPGAEPGAPRQAWALQVLEISDGRITGLHSFLDTERVFPLFGLPLELPA
ncbi:sigma-70 family RNA polymerase sigma factor [Streptomyces sp. NPDC051976]|uniref:sigma-70 family RNA polymerase sigma factor n=1 Tax=Streptomyces sp. NPDC051976 TaxID=3154947 RepID=UPI003443849F